MPPVAVTLKRIDLARWALCLCQHRVDCGAVGGVKVGAADAQRGLQMAGVAGADDNGGNLWPIEDMAGGHCGNAGIMAVGNVAQCLQQRLEQPPAAEFIDDQPVFDQ